ncbi:flagellar M-ring protein FliF [Loktanella fryxellensis]|uniref:Flagellar M-ring protein n=1 Tax=Loktanella fryxellensis TaxID=245187 RepID=A0A1H7ZPR1_9RHOB|nr:flagellar M-ring protein FliF [Loktanella fryxellensis]
MQGLQSVWMTLTVRRRMAVIGATCLMFLAVMLLTRSVGQRDMTLLFGGLEAAAAGDVITALDARGAVYEVRGGAIYVDATERDVLRMALAGEGLPAMTGQGYELLDTLSGFGTTSQMFDAAYGRAREGELARTIMASPAISAARVHIATPAGSPFRRAAVPTAAITVTTTGAALTAPQVRAFQHLVAAAVSGLRPEDVSVIDDKGGLLSDPGGAPTAAAGDDRAALLRERAERLLAARVGPGNAVVELTIDTVTDSEQIMERTFDPEGRIAVSTDITENSSNAQDSRNADVTIASNVPDGDAAGGNAGSSTDQTNETRSLTNYELSQTERQITRIPGAVKRLTIAVLVNDPVTTAPDGTTTTTPRSPEELADLTELVSSAVGLDAERGDVITLRAMAFEPLPQEGTVGEAPGLLAGPLDVMRLIQIAAAAIVALVLGLFVVRPILTRPAALAALPAPSDPGFQGFDVPLAIGGGTGGFPLVTGDPAADSARNGGLSQADAVARLRELIAERESETVQILQDWIETPQKETT